jgi:hypothetical protein
MVRLKDEIERSWHAAIAATLNKPDRQRHLRHGILLSKLGEDEQQFFLRGLRR